MPVEVSKETGSLGGGTAWLRCRNVGDLIGVQLSQSHPRLGRINARNFRAICMHAYIHHTCVYRNIAMSISISTFVAVAMTIATAASISLSVYRKEILYTHISGEPMLVILNSPVKESMSCGSS